MTEARESLFADLALASFATSPWSLVVGALCAVAPLILVYVAFCVSEPRER